MRSFSRHGWLGRLARAWSKPARPLRRSGRSSLQLEVLEDRLTPNTQGLSQTIDFTPPASPITFAVGETVQLSATGGGSINPVVFSIDSSSTALGCIYGNTLTVETPGTFVIDADQAGDDVYAPAPQVQQTLEVRLPGITAMAGGTAPPGGQLSTQIGGLLSLRAALTVGTSETDPLTLLVGVYGGGNPTTTPLGQGSFFDVRVTDSLTGSPERLSAGSSVSVTFDFPPTRSGATLLYFDPASQKFVPVVTDTLPRGTSSLGPSGGEITIVLDDSSFPLITALGGTVFTVALPADSTTTSSSDQTSATTTTTTTTASTSASTSSDGSTTTSSNVAASLVLTRGNGGPADTAGGTASVTFQTSSQLSVSLTPLQSGQAVVSQSAETDDEDGQEVAAGPSKVWLRKLQEVVQELLRYLGMSALMVDGRGAPEQAPPSAQDPAVAASEVELEQLPSEVIAAAFTHPLAGEDGGEGQPLSQNVPEIRQETLPAVLDSEPAPLSGMVLVPILVEGWWAASTDGRAALAADKPRRRRVWNG